MLAGAQISLSGKIEENRVKALNDAIREVVPNTESTERIEINQYIVYKCIDADGELVGWAIDGSGGGFVDKIRLVAGLDPSGEKYTGIKVIDNVETPGLGSKSQDPEWAGQYRDLDAGLAGGVEDAGAVGHFDRLSVDGGFDRSLFDHGESFRDAGF